MSSDTARDLAIQIEAQEDFYFFTRYMFKETKGYKWLDNWHHKVICDALMKVFRGETKRLIINIPPRYSKTEIAVKNFIAWCLGKVPDSEFIHCSYAASLAANNSYQTRNLTQEAAFRRVFPDFELSDDAKAKDHWRTAAGGVCYSAGAGGTITGFGAGKLRDSFGGGIIIDDAHKADEARSDVIRNGVIEWFQNTIESRTNSPNTPIIVIMQRLHEEDLAGWLLAGGNGEVWEHVCLEAIQPDGAALWPEKHSIATLRIMEQASPYVFAGQYQQRPAPLAGGFFKPGKIEIIDALPLDIVKQGRGWDLASTADGGDYTAGSKLLQTKSGFWIIADMVRGQYSPDEVETEIINAARRDGTVVSIRLPQDPGQAGKSQAKSLVGKLSGYSALATPESGDKATRASPFAAQVNVGNVKMLRAEWNDALVSELRNFPNGKHDDQVDALSGAFNHLNEGNLGLFEFYAEQDEMKRAAQEQAKSQDTFSTWLPQR